MCANWENQGTFIPRLYLSSNYLMLVLLVSLLCSFSCCALGTRSKATACCCTLGMASTCALNARGSFGGHARFC